MGLWDIFLLINDASTLDYRNTSVYLNYSFDKSNHEIWLQLGGQIVFIIWLILISRF